MAERRSGSVRNKFVGNAHTVVQAGDISGGVHIGDVHLVTGVPVRTRYREQVKRIAPQHLVDRELELAELAEFCMAPTGRSYSWWRAPAWSGKSALMSTFVLAPPAGVRVVSFFVTARWSAQNDRAAFVDNVLEQLLALLGEVMPPFLTESTREAHLSGLLDDAARACQDRGERLILLVDGLDEDRSVHVGADSHSIAALLPVHPPPGLRVVVAGRPNPPIPADVPPNHPLRDPAVVRTLTASPSAQAIRVEMERELKNQLFGPSAEQDLLGLVTVAGGGLSAADLADLAELPPYQVQDCLRTVTGRSFAHRGSHYRPGSAPDVFVLGHEELQVTALDMLGTARLDGYRDRLHTWAQRHRSARWPQGTPEYLLRGYFSMLGATGDLDRMVAYATDPARQDRMLDVSGGDAAALAEITTTLDAIADQPDLATMLRLAIHRDHLTDRNSTMPANLPAAWAVLGQVGRAESLANSITRLSDRVEALVDVAEVVADSGDSERAAALLDHAETVAHTIPDPTYQGWALLAVTRSMATLGDLDLAEATAWSIADHRSQARAWTSLASASSADRATELMDRAETAADAATSPFHRAHALRELASAVGNRDRAAAILDRAEAAAQAITGPDHARALGFVAVAMAANGDVDRGLAVTRSITDSNWDTQAEALRALTGAIAATGDVDRAVTTTHAIGEPFGQMRALVAIVEAVANHGELDQAEEIARSIPDPWPQGQALIAVARAAASAGNRDRAEAVARTIADPRCRQWASVAIVAAMTGSAELDSAETVLNTLTESHNQVRVLASVIRAAVRVGDHVTARTLLGQAEEIARATPGSRHAQALAFVARATAAIGDLAASADLLTEAESVARAATEPGDHVQRLSVPAAKALARRGDLDRAVALAHTITDPRSQAEALRLIVESTARANDLDRAEAIAHTIANPRLEDAEGLMHVVRGDRQAADELLDERGRAFHAIAVGAARNGDLDRASTLTESIDNPGHHAWALRSITGLAARVGDLDRAEKISRTISDPVHRVMALLAVAEASSDSSDRTRASRALDLAETTIAAITDSDSWLPIVNNTAQTAARCGDLDRALVIAGRVTEPELRAWVLQSIAVAAAHSGDLDRAEEIARTITDPDARARVVATVAGASAHAGDDTRAADFFDQADAIVRTISEPEKRVRALISMASLADNTGDRVRAADLLNRAEADAHTVDRSTEQSWALRSVAESVAAAGDFTRAKAIVNTIADPDKRGEVLRGLAQNHDSPWASSLADALRLSRWHEVAPQLIETAPEVLTVITDALAIISRADAV